MLNTEHWRAEALSRFPELEAAIIDAATPMELWGELSFAFDRAYETPWDEELIKRIYDFAEWSLDQDDEESDASEHLPMCVAISFWEYLGTNAAARADAHRWYPRDMIVENRAFFGYLIDNETFDDWIERYDGL